MGGQSCLLYAIKPTLTKFMDQKQKPGNKKVTDYGGRPVNQSVYSKKGYKETFDYNTWFHLVL